MSRHHQAIKNDPRWKAARAACFDRDGHACLECGATESLEADHVTRLADAPELAFDVDNLQTLCELCHDQKEREYQSRQLERVEWINERYPELIAIRGEKESDDVALFL